MTAFILEQAIQSLVRQTVLAAADTQVIILLTMVKPTRMVIPIGQTGHPPFRSARTVASIFVQRNIRKQRGSVEIFDIQPESLMKAIHVGAHMKKEAAPLVFAVTAATPKTENIAIKPSRPRPAEKPAIPAWGALEWPFCRRQFG